MQTITTKFEQQFRKSAVPPVRSGDTVKVHHLIKEGAKQRVQIFEGVVIRTAKLGELQATFTVRRLASGVGVEKSYLLHSPNVVKLEIIRRAKVRRNFLSYLRERRGKSARLTELSFDKLLINANATAPVEDSIDVEITDIAENQIDEAPIADVSTDEVAKTEDITAASADVASDADTATDDENLEAQELQAGVDKADNENTKAQA